MGKIYFMTLGYNAAKTLKRCVDSVLNQTKYGDRIEYWFCENGSTDNTRELIEEYARKDPRVKVLYNEKNMEWNEQSSVYWDLPKLMNDDDFLCNLDADDYYDLDFLEKMIPFVLDNNLDLAAAGSNFFDERSGQVLGQRKSSQILIVDTPEKFTSHFPVYHQFTRTFWGKVFSGRVAKHMLTHNNSPADVWDIVFRYGADTYMVYSALMHCNRIGISSDILHNYQVSSGSVSYKWYGGRFPCHVIQDEDAEKFLKRFGPLSKRNREFLYAVYANSVIDSIKVLRSVKTMTEEEKLKELRKAVDSHVTSDMMDCAYPEVSRARQDIFDAALEFGKDLKEENDDLKAALKLICPNCAPYISVGDIALYARDASLKNALYNDNMTELAEQLLKLISKNAYTKQFDLFTLIQRFSENKGLAAEITDSKFIKKHGDIFLLIWKNEYGRALDEMTDIILNNKSLNEAFYQVYMTLAALLDSVDEFLIGKIKLAVYYCNHNQIEECRAVLSELEEMGIQDNDDLLEIKAKLNNR
ncbi:MAG: glycosyltransferase family 2 protein [Oscillospiraceae bacterium]|nr:glycosyltransferase family 2 protein [Oscillospiraceae bacterium]